MLAHERAHARERHDLVLLPFTALCRAFPWSGSAQRAYAAVALLIEMLADDHALAAPPGPGTGHRADPGRRRPARPAPRRARWRWPAAGQAESGVCARVERLLAPAPGLSLPALALVSGAAAALVVVPVALLLFPV